MESNNDSAYNEMTTKIGAFIIGFIIIIVGIFVIYNGNTSYDEYKKSSDKQTVVAEVKSVYVANETRKTSTGTRTVKKYVCSFEYIVKNGAAIRYSETYYTEKKVGDKVTLNVYRDKNGKYQIAKITSKTDKQGSDMCGFIIILVGVIAFLYLGFSKSKNEEVKENEKW